MKKILLSALAIVGLTFGANAQKFFEAVTFTGAFPPAGTSYTAKIEGGFTQTFASGNWAEGWTNWYPNSENYAASTSVLKGDVSTDQSISGTVSLEGTVHVKNGATLTIAAGTVLRCATGATLIISKGAKINAIGTSTNPIIFTSAKAAGQRAPGDWAGILIIGNSQVNTSSGKRQYEALPNDPLAEYGGGRGAELNLADNSGEMRFVRIEFAGYNYLPDQELNGLTLGAVGSGTRVNFIQVSYARDDSFEWFGGTSKHKYLIAFAGVDDDFDMDEGYAGNVQFILGVRNPSVYETAAGGTSNGFEHDNNTGLGSASAVVPGVNDPAPTTAPFVSNATLMGPWAFVAQSSKPGHKFGRGLEMRSAVATSIYNSLVVGYGTLAQLVHPATTITPSVAYRLQNALNNNDAAGGAITRAEYKNTHLFGVTGNGTFTNTSASNQPAPVLDFANYMTAQNSNTASTISTTAVFENVITDFTNAQANISFAPKASSTLSGVAANFTGLIANNVFQPSEFASQPFATISKSSLSFGTKEVGQTFANISFTVDVKNLTGTGLSLSSNNASFVVDPTTATTVDGIKTFNVSFTKTTVGSESGTITINYGDSRLANGTIPVTATLVNPAEPILNTDNGTLTFTDGISAIAPPFTSLPQTVLVTGRNLKENVTVSAPSGYEISETPTGTFGSSLTFNRATNGTIAASFSVRLNTNSYSSTNARTLTITGGAAMAKVELSANTAAAFTVGSATIDVFSGNLVSTTSVALNIRGNRLPTSITLTPDNANIEVSVVSATAGWGATATLTTTGQITSTSSNVWVRYLTQSPAATTNGVQVGTISISGFSNVLPVSIRLNNPGATQSGKYILTDASSPFITALGFTFNNAISGTPFLYRASNNALIGQVSTIVGSSSVVELRANAAFSTGVATFSTITGIVDADVASDILTLSGGSFTASMFPVGLPLHLPNGDLLGLVSTFTAPNFVVLQAFSGFAATASNYGTSAILFKRPQATISVSPSAPLSLVTASYIDGVPSPVTGTIAITGANHDFPVTVGINPALTASGYMFEVYLGTPTTFAGSQFVVTFNPAANGTLNQTITIRYIPTNITLLSLPGVNVNAAHSTELLILGNNRTLSQGANSADPRATLAYNLRGSAFADVRITKTSLAKFSAYSGVASEIQKFSVITTRQVNPVIITAPANFLLSTSTDFSSATNTLSIPTVTGNSQSVEVNVRYLRASVGTDNGSISVATEGIASLLINVIGETYGFSSFMNIITEGDASTISLTGQTMVTVSGRYLTGALTLTATNGFGIAEDATATPASSLTFNPNPSDIGDVMPKVIYITYLNNATVVGTGTLTASSTGATDVVLNLVGGELPITSVENAVEAQVSVYPNPTEADATLAVELQGSESVSVVVYNLTGTVEQSFTDVAQGFKTYSLSGLSKGLHIIKVTTGKTVKVVKLIVQ